MAHSKPYMMWKKFPKLFDAMYHHSLEVDFDNPDDNSVIYSKLQANAQGKGEPYWVPEYMDMEPIYEVFRKLVEE